MTTYLQLHLSVPLPGVTPDTPNHEVAAIAVDAHDRIQIGLPTDLPYIAILSSLTHNGKELGASDCIPPTPQGGAENHEQP